MVKSIQYTIDSSVCVLGEVHLIERKRMKKRKKERERPNDISIANKMLHI